jgi:hypothetical protein
VPRAAVSLASALQLLATYKLGRLIVKGKRTLIRDGTLDWPVPTKVDPAYEAKQAAQDTKVDTVWNF